MQINGTGNNKYIAVIKCNSIKGEEMKEKRGNILGGKYSKLK